MPPKGREEKKEIRSKALRYREGERKRKDKRLEEKTKK
jgi:hypothetical protein